MIEQEKFEQIESFLNGNLSENEIREFQERLKNDSRLKEQIEEVENIGLAIQKAALREELNQFHQRLDTAPARTSDKPLYLNRYLKGIAAAVFMSIALGTGWFLFFGENKYERQFSKYYVPDPGLPTAMATGEDYDFQKAMVDYKYGEYEKAIDGWKSLADQNHENDTLQYFLGCAFLADNKPDDAIAALEKVATNNASGFRKDACWYLGLSHLKNGNPEEALLWIKKSEYKRANQIHLDLK